MGDLDVTWARRIEDLEEKFKLVLKQLEDARAEINELKDRPIAEEEKER